MRLLRLFAAGWLFGVAMAFVVAGDRGWSSLATCALGLAGAAALLLWATGARRFGVFLLAAAVGAQLAPPRSRASPALLDGAPWTLVGTVDGSPRIEEAGQSTAVRVTHAGARVPDQAAVGRIRLRTPPLVMFGPGDRVLFRGRVVAPGRRCNFGACDGLWRAAADGIDGSVFVADRALVVRAAVRPIGVAAWLWALRRQMAARIAARLPAPEAALVAALVVGERGGLSAEEEDRFRAAGVTHLLSVSGLHLAFAAGLLFGLVRWLLRRIAPGLGRRRPRDRWAVALALPVVAAYAVLTGSEVATVRAALVVGHAFVGIFAGRRARGFDALVFAVLAITLPCPAACVEPSFQLSFVAAWATLATAQPLITGSRARRMLGQASRLVLASFAATIATAPITVWHFNQIAPVGIVSNVFAVPLTEAAIVPLGIVGALVDLAFPPVGACLLAVAGALAALLRAFVAWTAGWAPVWSVQSPPAWLLVLSLVGLLWIAAGRSGWRRLLVVILVLGVCTLGERAWLRLRPRLEITFIDVGQGDASVLRLPTGEVIVIDGGGGGRSDPGAQILAPFLVREGVSRIALVVLSHPHPDHAGGLAELVRRFHVDEIWDNGQPSEDPTVRALLAAAADRGVPVRRPCDRRFGALSIHVLAPSYDGRIAADPLASENDNSIVLRVEYAGHAALFAGDVEAQAEAGLVARGIAPVDLLKVPHHGSRTSSTEELLDALRPRLAVAQLAIDNRYRFPHPDVVARYRQRGVRFLRNDRDGAVRVRIDAGGLHVTCARPGGCGDDG